MEAMLHEEGYSYLDMSKIHMAERRRLMEGKATLEEVRRKTREDARSDNSPERRDRVEGRRARAQEAFAEKGRVA